ncbi:MAG: hypothetical protein IIB04_05335 [Acidobacteria bacterium]|nr:hypothetical protein [Acidobacteriota bacterium]
MVRVVHHYGARPEFVVLGGLVPELLCSNSAFHHAGATDVDVQVDLEIACGSVNTVRLESALRNADFVPSADKVWRWQARGGLANAIVKFELLADLDYSPSEATIEFDGCDDLGALNLRGTGFAAEDVVVLSLAAHIDGVRYDVEVNVTGLAGFLLAKTAAAYSRRLPKDWYDIAFVLLHNNRGGPHAAGREVVDRFGDALRGSVRTALGDLVANFETPSAQGSQAYVSQFAQDHPEIGEAEAAADAVAAVREFHATVLPE